MNYQMLKKIAAFYGRFTLSYTQIGYRARRLFWSQPKLKFGGQRWLVTGASGGLGRQIALSAAQAGATVVAAARNAAKLDALLADARAQGIAGIETAICDFSLQTDTARFARSFAAAHKPIDVLVNNVGVLNDDHSLTAEGRESSFTINILSHYLLTEILIHEGAFAPGNSLVINMTSGGGYNATLNPPTMNNVYAKTFNGTVAYGQHKRGQMALNQHWRARYAARGMTFYVMHPGWADTDGVKRSLPRFRKILKSVLRDSASGADTALWLAAMRPAQQEEDLVWFDRKARPAHMYPHTRLAKATPQTLVDYLESELQRIPAASL
jgi:dehydrogenase/reductase SDR family protein 12